MRDRRVGFHEFLLYVHSVRLFSLTLHLQLCGEDNFHYMAQIFAILDCFNLYFLLACICDC